jgi:hypothetical protein
MNNSRIVLISTVINKELYQKSSKLFPKDIPRFVIDGVNGMHGLDSIFYLMKKLKDRDIKWLIMADEDVLFENSDMVFDIIKKMESQNYSVCGIRDGGLISHRNYNPYLINTFFSIMNFKEVELIWNKKEVLKNQYILNNEFDDDLTNLNTEFDTLSVFEPYYCFYLWLRRNKKQFLFLDTKLPFPDDELTNAVYFEENILLYHTWHARSYGINKKHTNRINKVFEVLQFKNETIKNATITNEIVLKHRTFIIIKRARKLCNRIKMRIHIISNTVFKLNI